jgi:hypothetical protein
VRKRRGTIRKGKGNEKEKKHAKRNSLNSPRSHGVE